MASSSQQSQANLYVLQAATPRELLLWVLRRRRRYRVTGYSMQPLLNPGDDVLVNRHAYRRRLPREGEIVVAEHPSRRGFWLIKRVVAVLEDETCILMGLNLLESTDSRTFGSIPTEKLLGQVTCRFG